MAIVWYVLHTYSGHEQKAKRHLEAAIKARVEQDPAKWEGKFGRVEIPVEAVTEVRGGKKINVNRKYFPNYMLIECELSPDTESLVLETPGITSFLTTPGGKPRPLMPKEVADFLHLVEGTPVVVPTSLSEVPYKVGDQVQVVEGPFRDFTGVIHEINPERAKVKVMVSIFGRSTPLELDFHQVREASKKEKATA